MYSAQDGLRFWSKVDKTEACWLWTGCATTRGYGLAHMGGKLRLAHRCAWELTTGEPIGSGMQVCHHCDVLYAPGDWTYRRCVNPTHLFLGTARDNVHDCMAKGRTARGDANGRRVHPERWPCGSAEPHAKLDEDAVREILKQYSNAQATMAQLARRYGVSTQTVWRVVHGLAWRHVSHG